MADVLGIYGCGGLGREVLELAGIINEEQKRWREIVFIDDSPKTDAVNGAPVMTFNDADSRYSDTIEYSIAIGEPASRQKVITRLDGRGVSFATLIHPGVHIPATTVIEDGTAIQYGCFISCNVHIGRNSFIQPQANVGHDCIMKGNTIVSGLCNIAGHVTIGANTYLGLGACIRENVTIGDWTIVGMGSMVHKDIPDEMIAMGNPARPMKRNEEHRVFG